MPTLWIILFATWLKSNWNIKTRYFAISCFQLQAGAAKKWKKITSVFHGILRKILHYTEIMKFERSSYRLPLCFDELIASFNVKIGRCRRIFSVLQWKVKSCVVSSASLKLENSAHWQNNLILAKLSDAFDKFNSWL